MKKNKYLLSVLLTLTLILAACGSSDSGQEAPEQIDDTNNVDEVDVTEQEDEAEDPTEENTDDNTTPVTENPVEDSNEQNGATSDDNFFDEATQVNSDTQNFSIHLLPDYTLTGEEPGKDVLYLDADDSIFMRIETMSPEASTANYLTENLIEILTATGGQAPTELTDANELPTNGDLKNVKGYSTNAEDITVTGYVFERDDLLVRLTIFDSSEQDHLQDFLNMGSSIVKSE